MKADAGAKMVGPSNEVREMLIEDIATFASVYHAAMCCWTFASDRGAE